MVDDPNSSVTCRPRSPYWLEDGSLILLSHRDLYKVHKTLLFRNSPTLATWISQFHDVLPTIHQHFIPQFAGCTFVKVPDDIGLRNEDLEALLEHLYHDVPLSCEAPFSRIASVLRASSPKQLNFPAVHELSVKYISTLFPSGPRPFLHSDYLQEALMLATEYNLPIHKGLLYSIVTTSNFDTESDGIHAPTFSEAPSQNNNLDLSSTTSILPSTDTLSPTDVQRCRRLMAGMIEHFTPILFTPATTPHMACTDVFADMWMSVVIQPALENSGVYKPLETLQNIIDIGWGKLGLCLSCVTEKRAEWTREQECIWEKMDKWID